METFPPKTFADGNKYLERAKILFNEGKNQLALHLTDVVINGSTLENETLLEAYTLKSQILEEKIKEETAFIAQNSYLNGLADVKDKIRNSINKP